VVQAAGGAGLAEEQLGPVVSVGLMPAGA
jgi:hypothetical protein